MWGWSGVRTAWPGPGSGGGRQCIHPLHPRGAFAALPPLLRPRMRTGMGKTKLLGVAMYTTGQHVPACCACPTFGCSPGCYCAVLCCCSTSKATARGWTGQALGLALHSEQRSVAVMQDITALVIFPDSLSPACHAKDQIHWYEQYFGGRGCGVISASAPPIPTYILDIREAS